MTVPTRFIEQEEFNELMAQEGNVLPLYRLVALPFNPPSPDGPPMHAPELIGVNVLLLNVSENCLFRDKHANMGFVIMNGYNQEESFTWENFQDCHIVNDAWCYRLAPGYWDEADSDYDLDDAIYRFKPEKIPPWELGN